VATTTIREGIVACCDCRAPLTQGGLRQHNHISSRSPCSHLNTQTRTFEYRTGTPRFSPHAHRHPTAIFSQPPGHPPPSCTMEEPPEGFPSVTNPHLPAPNTATTAAALLSLPVPPAPHLAAAPRPAEGVMASMASAASEEATNGQAKTNKRETMSHLWVYFKLRLQGLHQDIQGGVLHLLQGQERQGADQRAPGRHGHPSRQDMRARARGGQGGGGARRREDPLSPST